MSRSYVLAMACLLLASLCPGQQGSRVCNRAETWKAPLRDASGAVVGLESLMVGIDPATHDIQEDGELRLLEWCQLPRDTHSDIV